MKKPKVLLSRLSPRLADGSRNTVATDVLATCNGVGIAEIIAKLLRENTYKDLLLENDGTIPDKEMYLISVGY